MEQYRQSTLACSKVITRHYSTSFSLGIYCLAKRYHEPIYGIYGFVRYADEIVDTFHQYDKQLLLDRFEADTYQAIREGISLNPVLHAFQWVVNQYNIPQELIAAFLSSMRMDLTESVYDSASYAEYIYGSAEVVGLMCLCVFCEGDSAQYEALRPAACKLGAAFQKVNFLRDVRSDWQERGRTYFPGVNLQQFDAATKAAIEADIAADFQEAYQGIKRLPQGAQFGVYVAYRYYIQLFRKIQAMPPERILQRRIRVSNSQKMGLLVLGYVRVRFGSVLGLEW
jgi:15-cis-phytoene synthase